jgi:hypothetical protein
VPKIPARWQAALPALIAAAVAALCLFGETAKAATYDVTSCNRDGTAAGWAAYGTTAFQTLIACPYNGDLTSRGLGVANWPNIGWINNSSGGLLFRAPSGTSLVGFGAAIRIQRWDGPYAIGLFSGSGQPLYSFWANDGNGAVASSYTPQAWFNLNRESAVDLGIRCPSFCDTTAMGPYGVRAWVQLFDPITIRIEDDDAPVETLTGGDLVSNAYATATESVTYNATDASGIRATRLYVDGSKLRDDPRTCNYEQPVPCSNISGGSYSLDTRSLSDGPHVVKVETVDAAGNARAQSRSINVDNTAPTAPVVGVGGGDGWRSSNDFTAAWTSPDDQTAPIAKAHYQLCATGQPADCQPAGVQGGADIVSLTGLTLPAEGDYTLSVWLEDAAGNSSAAKASAPVHLRYDATSPGQARDVSVGGGEGWRSRNSFDLAWDNPDGQLAPITSARYRLCDSTDHCTTETRDGAEGLDSLSGISVPAPGDYTLALWLGDQAGNSGDGSGSPMVHLRFDDADPGEAAPAAPGDWLSATDVADGYDLHVGLAPGDAVGPSGLAGFAVSTDGSEPGTSPSIGPDGLLHLAELPEGRLVVKARAISNSGVASSRVGSAVIAVDKSAPRVTVSDAPDADEWQAHAVSVVLQAADQPGLSGMSGGHVSYSIDGGPMQVVAGESAAVTVAADGRHSIAYSATDQAGNRSQPETVSFMVDATPPGDPALSDPGRWLNASDADEYVQHAWLADEAGRPLSGIAGYSFTTDGSAPDGTVDSTGEILDLGRLAEGTTVVKARSVSGSGLASRGVGTVDLHVDRTAPDISLVSVPEAENWQKGTVELRLRGRDALSGMGEGSVAYSVDAQPETSVPGDTAVVEVDGNGSHTVQFYAVDAAGNRADAKTARFKIDGGKPGAAVPESSAGWITSSAAYLEHIRLAEGETLPLSGLAGFSVTTDGSAPDGTPETGPDGDFSLTRLSDGVTTVKARAISGAGIASDSVGIGTVKVDRTPPVVVLERPHGDSLVARMSDGVSGIGSGSLEIRASGTGSWRDLGSEVRDGRITVVLGAVPGSYDLRATAIDAAGNRRVVTTFADGQQATVTIAPSVTGTQPAPVSPNSPKAPAPRLAPSHVRCAVKTKRHPKRAKKRHHAAKHHRRRVHKRHRKPACRPGGEKHRHRHLGGKTHKRARRTAG